MYRRCGIRSNRFVWDLYHSLIADDVTEKHWTKIDDIKKSLQNKLIFDGFSRNIIFYNKRYALIYYPERISQEVACIVTRIVRQKAITDSFSIRVAKTTVITRRKKVNKLQNEPYTIYTFHRIFLRESYFLPSCIALRIAGYQLQEVYF